MYTSVILYRFNNIRSYPSQTRESLASFPLYFLSLFSGPNFIVFVVISS